MSQPHCCTQTAPITCCEAANDHRSHRRVRGAENVAWQLRRPADSREEGRGVDHRGTRETYLEPKWGYGYYSSREFVVQGWDYHPPTLVGPGENFLLSVYNALRAGKKWNETLFIVTFDEHGGTFDHVAPSWRATNPDGKHGKQKFGFNLFGMRVPTLLISPFIPPSTVFRAKGDMPFDHTSFIKTLLGWAGVDFRSVDFGKRMPQAPTFEGVLSDTIVNTADLSDVEPAEYELPRMRSARCSKE